MKKRKGLPTVEENAILSETVKEMILAMLAFGFFYEAIILIFRKSILSYSLGLLFGVIIAIGMCIHMSWALNRALDLDRKNAVGKMQLYNMLRYVFVIILFTIIIVTKIANPLTAFLGIMTLKFSAYLQPFTHKLCNKLKRNH